MAFNVQNLECATLGWKNSQQRVFNYLTDDTVAVTKASGYFATEKLRKGDLIQATCNGVAALFKVESVSPVTVTTGTFA